MDVFICKSTWLFSNICLYFHMRKNTPISHLKVLSSFFHQRSVKINSIMTIKNSGKPTFFGQLEPFSIIFRPIFYKFFTIFLCEFSAGRTEKSPGDAGGNLQQYRRSGPPENHQKRRTSSRHETRRSVQRGQRGKRKQTTPAQSWRHRRPQTRPETTASRKIWIQASSVKRERQGTPGKIVFGGERPRPPVQTIGQRRIFQEVAEKSAVRA